MSSNSYRPFYLVLVFFLTIGLTACPRGGGAPTATATPAIRPISSNEVITITFSRSIDTISLSLSGTMADQSNGGIWSDTDSSNDTLTLSPTVAWTNGTARTLTINANSSSGTALSPLSLTYDVFNGTIYYVSSAASDDSGSGTTPATAKATIRAAINAASAPAVVVVNAGSYNVNSDTGGTPTHVVLKEGVSLYGGYSSDFADRGSSFISSITDTSSSVTGGGYNSSRVIEAGTGITTATIIDGFSINGSIHAGADYTTAILVINGGSPIIQNNTLNGGNGSQFSDGLYSANGAAPTILSNTINGGGGSNQSHGIDLETSSPLISGNTINGGTGNSSGIRCRSNSNPVIQNNTIHGGSNNGNGIYSSNSSPTITNNSINGGDGLTTYAIYNDTSSSPSISRNIIHGGNSTNASYGIYNVSASPKIFNNTIFGGTSSISSYGIFNVVSSPKIFNNTIFGGTSSNASFGITNGSSTSIVRNNIIDGGDGPNAYGMTFNTNAVSIDNNIIFTSGGSSAAYCLYEENAAGDPASVQNNDLYACATALYYDFDAGCTSNEDTDGNNNTCSLNEMETLASANALNNTSIDPGFSDIDGADNNIATMEDNDWHFSGSSPSAVTAGGLNGIDEGWVYTKDKNGVTRPSTGNPWSMGAYEP